MDDKSEEKNEVLYYDASTSLKNSFNAPHQVCGTVMEG